MVIAGMKKSQKTITELCKYILYLTLAHTLNWVRSEGDLGGEGDRFCNYGAGQCWADWVGLMC